MSVLTRRFFSRDPVTVARALLGKKLVRELDGDRMSGMVTETEAYLGTSDSASHAFRGRTPRNAVMFGPAGVAYIYFVYGMHHLLNVVTGKTGEPSAVLIRALDPLEGVERMEFLRGRRGRHLADGPAKLCRALGVDTSLNGWDLTRGRALWFETCRTVAPAAINSGPRVGIAYARQEDQRAPLRFWVKAPAGRR